MARVNKQQIGRLLQTGAISENILKRALKKARKGKLPADEINDQEFQASSAIGGKPSKGGFVTNKGGQPNVNWINQNQTPTFPKTSRGTLGIPKATRGAPIQQSGPQFGGPSSRANITGRIRNLGGSDQQKINASSR
jgi:hypothetical protein